MDLNLFTHSLTDHPAYTDSTPYTLFYLYFLWKRPTQFYQYTDFTIWTPKSVLKWGSVSYKTSGSRTKSGLWEPYILEDDGGLPICRDFNWGRQLFMNPVMLKSLGNASEEHNKN